MNYKTPNKSYGTNKKIFIILHHTASNNINGTISWFKNPAAQVSAHYVIGMRGEVAQFENNNTILWHAGQSRWTTSHGHTFSGLNQYSIGIEICNDGENFTNIQRDEVRKLISNLLEKHSIGTENILRHKDVSGYRGKVDPYDTLRNNEYKTFKDYQNSFNPNYDKMTEDQKKAGVKTVSNLCSSVYDSICVIEQEIDQNDLSKQLQEFKLIAKETKQILRDKVDYID